MDAADSPLIRVPVAHPSVALAPVTGRARIDVLDMLRGLAILGILFMNIPFMGGSVMAFFGDVRLQGWAPADRWVWSFLQVTMEGTQRGTLEFLFGAGMMILTARAMDADGPVAVADLYMRRTLWLLVFGLVDALLLLWVGDILHTYALAALLLFPFRKLAPDKLLMLGLLYATAAAIGIGGGGAIEYAGRVQLVHRVEAVHVAQARHEVLTRAQQDTLAEWQKKLARYTLSPKQKADMVEEAKARRGAFGPYAAWMHSQWIDFAGASELFNVAEAFSAMLLGIALYKWGIIQGLRTKRFYLVMALAAYGFGMGARAIGVAEDTTFAPGAKTIWITAEYARLAVSLGHVALINLLARTKFGMTILSPFKAAGRTAFSLYVCETIIGVWILFPGFGFGLWNHYGWAGLAVAAALIDIGLLIVANLWVIWFASGPLEWAWRSLAYCRMQPFLKRRGVPEPMVVGP